MIEGKAGIDYGMGTSNRDIATGIHYGVIHLHNVMQAWCDSSEPYYGEEERDERIPCEDCNGSGLSGKEKEGKIEVECTFCNGEGTIENDEYDDMQEALCYVYDEDGYKAQSDDMGDIFITKSPYYCLCIYCSPCAPGAGDCMHEEKEGIKAYCFGHEWFEEGKAPYTVYSVANGEEIKA